MSTSAETTPAAEPQPVKNESSTVESGQQGGNVAPAETTEESSTNLESARTLFKERALTYLAEQQKHVIVPSYAAWFNLDAIHSIEKKLFPDFFPTKQDEHHSIYKTPEIYKNMRDFMVNSYRVNPLEYITVTAIRRNLAGDVTSIIRVHHFLEKWGLINYQIDPRTKSCTVGPQYTGHFQVTLDTPTGLVPFVPEGISDPKESTVNEPQETNTTTSAKQGTDSKATDDSSIPLNLEVRHNVYTKTNELTKKATVNTIQFFCNICGNDCTSTRYHNLKVKSYNSNPNSTANNASVLCVECYEQGLFPLNFYSSDFIQLKEETKSSNVWSEQEVLLLLEAIEVYATYDTSNNGTSNTAINTNGNGQWDKIAEYVGTKSKEECLVKFIQLPIEDRYLNKLAEPKKQSGISQSNLTLIQDIVKEIVNNKQTNGIATTATNKAEAASSEQQQIINQIIELTLEKVSTKLSHLDILEQNLLEAEKKLQQERKQLLFERWSHYEKINKYKESQPELASIFDDLLTPIKIQEVVKPQKEADEDSENNMQVDSTTSGINGLDSTTAPVSVSQPKSYQFWSG